MEDSLKSGEMKGEEKNYLINKKCGVSNQWTTVKPKRRHF